MWIQQIELSNFKAYQNQIFLFQNRKWKKHGSDWREWNGKTTFWRLFIFVCMVRDATSSCVQTLKKMLIQNFCRALHGNNSISVLIPCVYQFALCQDDYGYDVQQWYFDPRGNYKDQEERLYEVRNGGAAANGCKRTFN